MSPNQALTPSDSQQRPETTGTENVDRRTRRPRPGEETEDLRHKNDSGPPEEEHIDDLDSRIRRPLPNRRPMPEPQPSDNVKNPTHEDEYPYGKLTRANYANLEQKPAGYGINFTNRIFPQPYVPTPLLLKNMKDFQRDHVAKDRDNVLGLVPYGAGPRWESKYGDRAIVAIRDWIMQVEFPEKGKCQVSKAEAQTNKDRRDFGHPWTIVLYDISPPFRAWLLDLGVVALSEPGATFMVHSFSERNMSWVLLNFIGPAVTEEEDGRIEALIAIKEKVFTDRGVDNVIRDLVAAKASEEEYPDIAKKSHKQIVAMLTSSFRLVYIPCNDKNGRPCPRFQLRGRPISLDKEVQRKWVMALRAIKYNVRFKILNHDKSDFGCVWCKGEDHPGHACPYPDFVGERTDADEERWLGPTREQMTTIMKNPSDWKQHSSGQETQDGFVAVGGGRGAFPSRRGTPRGYGSYRGQGRGNPLGYGTSPIRGRGRGGLHRGMPYTYTNPSYNDYPEYEGAAGWN
ncbi:hypothetical protein F5050DRAFT_1709502 [Lentinula boryana]|uniref:Uncharacterized protein n=1 Tax=Lentinula boryana TaxID=40481 RepID=A0ABQ8QMZ2_9AGAR|nr:hypothetical protein F5050DRAFT_1709502 [Lentinula boryana]